MSYDYYHVLGFFGGGATIAERVTSIGWSWTGSPLEVRKKERNRCRARPANSLEVERSNAR